MDRQTVASYDAFSEDYDRFVNWNNRLAFELPFIEQNLRSVQVEGRKTAVLDVACGTGVHTIALAKRGYLTAGADLSAGMIERARENARRSGTDVDFQVAGFGSLKQAYSLKPFDALICLGNSLPHVLTLRDLSTTLADFAACLQPGGILIIQNRNFDAVLAHQERWMEPQSYREGEREWIFQRFYDFRPDGLLNFHVVTLRREKPAAPWTQRDQESTLYPLRENELRKTLESSGFLSVQAYGGLNGVAFAPLESPNLVITAVKI